MHRGVARGLRFVGHKKSNTILFSKREINFVRPFSGLDRKHNLTPKFTKLPSRNYSSNLEHLSKILTPQQKDLITKEKEALSQLLDRLIELGGVEDDINLLRTSAKKLDEMFMLVVVGEFNSGKSSFLNALLGDKFLREGVTPTTSEINLIKYGGNVHTASAGKDMMDVFVPVDWLKDIILVDTPGTNAIIRTHEQITEHFIPQSDLIMFVTSVDRPFSESERKFLERIEKWRKKVVVVLTKVDILDNVDKDLVQITSFIQGSMKGAIDTKIFPISSKLAIKAKQSKQSGNTEEYEGLWKQSRFGVLESFISNTLDSRERLRLKLVNPIGVGERLIEQYTGAVKSKISLLDADIKTLKHIDGELDQFTQSMKEDYQFHKSAMKNIIHHLNERGMAFFDAEISITNITSLMQETRIQRDFEKKVISSISVEIERSVSQTIDWVVSKSAKEWKRIIEYLQDHTKNIENEMVGKISSDFVYNRQQLLDSMGADVRHVVEKYNLEEKSANIAANIRASAYQTAMMEIGAVGVGAVVGTSFLDISGVIPAGVLAITGLAVLPYKKMQLKKQFAAQLQKFEQSVTTTIEKHFEKELLATLDKIREGISPYKNYVKGEKLLLENTEKEFVHLKEKLQELRVAATQA